MNEDATFIEQISNTHNAKNPISRHVPSPATSVAYLSYCRIRNTQKKPVSLLCYSLIIKLHLLKLLQALLPVGALNLGSLELLLLRLLDGLADLLLPVLVHDLLLARDGLVGLFEAVLGLGDFLGDVDAALDVEEGGGRGANGVDGAAGGGGVGGGEDCDGGDGLAGERLEGGDGGRRGEDFVGSGVESLDVGGARVLDGVLAGEGAETLGASDEEFIWDMSVRFISSSLHINLHSASAASSSNSGVCSGNAARETERVLSPSLLGRRCQSSSVRKGMKG